MSSRLKGILIGLILLVVCGVAAAVLLLTRPEAPAPVEEEAPPEVITSRLIFDLDPKKILSVIISNEHGVYDIGRFVENDTDVWMIEEFKEIPLDSNFVISILTNAASFTAARVITETPDDLSVYGLEKPRADILTAFDDGTIKNLLVGNPSPTVGETYVKLYDSDTVYTMKDTTVAPFLEDKFSAINKTVYTPLQGETDEQNLAATIIHKMTIDRIDIPYDIVIDFDQKDINSTEFDSNSSSYVLVSPVDLNLHPEKCEPLMTKVFNLTADTIAVVLPDEAAKAEYGFDDPYGSVTMDNVSGPFAMTMGNEIKDDNGKVTGRYGMVDGIDVIFTFKIADIPWATVMPIDITAPIITTNYIFNIDGLDIVGSGVNDKFVVTGTSNDDFAVSKDGAAVDGEAFKILYEFLLKAPAEELYIEDTDAEPALTIRIYGEGIDDIVEFIPVEDRRTIIRRNGQVCFKCKTTYVNRLISNMELFNNGEEIIMTW